MAEDRYGKLNTRDTDVSAEDTGVRRKVRIVDDGSASSGSGVSRRVRLVIDDDDYEEERPVRRSSRYEDEDDEPVRRSVRRSSRYEDEDDDEPVRRSVRRSSRYEDEDDEPVRRSVRRSSRYEDEDDEPVRKSVRRASRYEDEDDDEPVRRNVRRSSRYEDDDEPVRRNVRRTSRYEDEDDGEEERPVRRVRKPARRAPQIGTPDFNVVTRSRNLLPILLKAAAIALIAIFIGRQFTTEKMSDSPYETVEAAVKGAAALDTMQEGDNQMIKRLYGLDPNTFEGIMLYYPTSNMGAEEVLLVKLGDETQKEAVSAAIEKRLATQLDSFEGYGVDQTAMLKKAIVNIQGNYALFVSADDPDTVNRAFEDAL